MRLTITAIFIGFIIGFEFLQAQDNPNNSDLTESPSGLKYKITKLGNGSFPKSGDKVWVHYYAKFLNDSIYDSSAETGPAEFFLGQGQLIKGWEEGLRLIKPGGSILLVVPPALAYGAEGQGKVPPNATLVFEIALMQVDTGNPIESFNIEGLEQFKAKKGLKYYKVKNGSGPYAQLGDNAFVHYTGLLPDGKIFDSSYKKDGPVQIVVGTQQVMEGWDMGLFLMNKGAKIKLQIPAKLAFGKAGYKTIVPPNTPITLDIEMVDLLPPPPVKRWDITGQKILETPSGLKYVVFEQGYGDLIQKEDIVVVHYSGYFTNGKLFDSSVKRFKPISFPVGKNAVIDGWDEALLLMRKGSKFQLIIPSNLAYGEEGAPPTIPAYADLIFDIELIEIIK